MRRHLFPLLATTLLLLAPSAAHAWLRVPYEDAQVVERSTLIVVAHLKPGTLQYVDNTQPNAGHSWEYHATLVITQTLKGKPEAQEIPIVLFYGIEALVEGKVQHDAGGQNPGTFPKGSIQLLNYADFPVTLCADATQDQLWLLQQRSGYRGDTIGGGSFGIADPEEIQPLALLDYFKCYLAQAPEAAVKAYLPQHPDVTTRGTHYLDHLELQRTAQIQDPVQRVEKLLPFFTRRFYWGLKNEAYTAMTSASPEAAGPALLKLFNDPAKTALRGDILNAWVELRYAGCLDTLLDLLRAEDQFWATQKLESGWWNKAPDSQLTADRRRHYGDLIGAVRVLGTLANPRAREPLEQILTRWRTIPSDDPQMLDAITASLKNLPASP